MEIAVGLDANSDQESVDVDEEEAEPAVSGHEKKVLRCTEDSLRPVEFTGEVTGVKHIRMECIRKHPNLIKKVVEVRDQHGEEENVTKKVTNA